MKINTSTLVCRYNGKPVMIDQEVYLLENGQPLVINGMPHMSGGREMTVADIFSTILSQKKLDQFNVLKADMLGRRFYRAETVDIDDSDYGAFLDIIEHNDQFVPLVLAYAKRALIEAKEGLDRVHRDPGKTESRKKK